MRQIENGLIVRVAVNRDHRAVHEAEVVANNFDHGRQAIRGARRIRNDVVFGRIVLVAVDAHDNGDVFVGGGCRDDDFFRAGVAMFLGVGRLRETARRFQHDVNFQVGPWQFGRIFFGENFDTIAVDRDAVRIMRYVALEDAVHGIVLEEMRECVGIREVVDRHEVEIGAALQFRGAQNLAPDAAEAVNANTKCHAS